VPNGVLSRCSTDWSFLFGNSFRSAKRKSGRASRPAFSRGRRLGREIRTGTRIRLASLRSRGLAHSDAVPMFFSPLCQGVFAGGLRRGGLAFSNSLPTALELGPPPFRRSDQPRNTSPLPGRGIQASAKGAASPRQLRNGSFVESFERHVRDQRETGIQKEDPPHHEPIFQPPAPGPMKP